MEAAGAAVVIEDFALTPEALADAASELLGDPDRLERMAVRARGLARPDAAERVAAEILGAIG
jgi:UDP-N-acetylglucosamine--N-acetylmuramyl-(pentapeptide) pyrophosphoryl-undecaprenol N-acetylglucosamine transferase